MLIEPAPLEAVEHLRFVADHHGERNWGLAIVARANLGRAMVEADDTEAGERLLLRSITELASDVTAPRYDLAFLWGMLGDARRIAGRVDAARDACTKGLSTLPKEAYAQSLRDDLRSRRGQLSESAEPSAPQTDVDDSR